MLAVHDSQGYISPMILINITICNLVMAVHEYVTLLQLIDHIAVITASN